MGGGAPRSGSDTDCTECIRTGGFWSRCVEAAARRLEEMPDHEVAVVPVPGCVDG